MRPTLQVMRTGPLALIQDLGRIGKAHLGVGRSGAADRSSHSLANRLVANPDHLGTIEVTLGGMSFRVIGEGAVLAVTGADSDPSVNGIPFGSNSVQQVSAGDVVSLGAPRAGLRTYVAVRGGVSVAPVLGSRSFDVLSGIGPPPLKAGDRLPIGPRAAGDYPAVAAAPVAAIADGLVELQVVPGPRDDWFRDADALVHRDWIVSDRSDRVGIRLIGKPLELTDPSRQLPSEGVTRGAIQVPPGGQPVILGPDHPITGGYPVIGVIIDNDVDLAAQIRPGQAVRFRWTRARLK